ncbi:hypothetical protein AAHA92_15301 [Salvia divinorum]|uniref:Uncharacterized protein n=1 Tax=Salvia divinorum TaxID=28513 RepID=A0ABD1HGY1_SALDI
MFKQVLRAFNFKEFSNISLRAKEATKELEELQTKADKDVGNVAIQEQINVMREKAEYLTNSEKDYFSQKAGLKHLIGRWVDYLRPR